MQQLLLLYQSVRHAMVLALFSRVLSAQLFFADLEGCCQEHDILRGEPHVLSFLRKWHEWKKDKDSTYESISQRSSSNRHPYRISASHLFPHAFEAHGADTPSIAPGGLKVVVGQWGNPRIPFSFQNQSRTSWFFPRFSRGFCSFFFGLWC